MGGELEPKLRAVQWSVNALLVGALFLLAMGIVPTPVQSQAPVNVTSSLSTAWRTGFHFQPRKNWMNDPNGPQYYKGYYHLFYQYNPYAALWGNITWAHAVSTDLIHWKYLEDAAVEGGPGWYDFYGAWSGSATLQTDGTPYMMYTGWSNLYGSQRIVQYQTQNLVVPKNASDPLLQHWVKSDHNPVILAEPFMDPNKFRDPTEGWQGADGQWRILLGGRLRDNTTGTAYVYKSPDFVNWTYVKELHTYNGTGMWECPDLYPVALSGKKGLRTYSMEPKNEQVKHIVKVSLENFEHDFYSLGHYDEANDTFTPDSKALDVGVGLRYDYGKFYASKTFFDSKTGRRILWGWINESTSDQNAVVDGWSGVQSIPRHVYLDPATHSNLILYPIVEVDELHTNKTFDNDFNLTAGSVKHIDGVSGPQLDIEVTFYKPESENFTFNGTFNASNTAEELCSINGTLQGFHGPFGVLALADSALQEFTAVYFYLSQFGGKWTALFCGYQGSSSSQIGVDETTYGTYLKVLETDAYLTLRVLLKVDHSIVESYAQGGRSAITARVYPTIAVGSAAQAFLFNNGTTDIKVKSLIAWEMANINLAQFPGIPTTS